MNGKKISKLVLLDGKTGERIEWGGKKYHELELSQFLFTIADMEKFD